MILLAAISAGALALGLLMPLRWGLWGFLGATAVLFAAQAGANAAMGFAGSSLEESLLLFNGSYVAYLGFNLQITYRAFALPELLLAAAFIARMSRR